MPQDWDVVWENHSDATFDVLIGELTGGLTVSAIEVNSIELNDTVRIVPGSDTTLTNHPAFNGQVLRVSFSGQEAVRSLPSLKLNKSFATSLQFSTMTGATASEGEPVALKELPPRPPQELTVETNGRAINLSWEPNSEVDLQGYRLYRDLNPNPNTQITTITKGENTFRDTTVSSGNTYYYRLTAVDERSNESLSSKVSVFLYPPDIAVDVGRNFEGASDPENYRLVALPGAVDRPVKSTLNGQAGVDWQAFWDDGSETDYLMRFDGSDRFRFEPGVGFWLISTQDWNVDKTFKTVTLEGDTVATLSLHDGWNIISNPLDKAVPWSAVEAATGVTLQALWEFDGGFAAADTFRSARGGEAFYLLNDQDLDSLSVPYPGAPTYPGESESKALAAEEAPTLTLGAYQNGERFSGVQIGLAPEAEAGLDAYDQFAPPGRFEAATLRLKAPGTPESKRLRYLAHEWRPPGGDGHAFDLTLAAEEGPIDLRAVGVDRFDRREVRLIDEATGRPYDLRQVASVTLRPEGEPRALTLAIGTEAFVDEKTAEAAPDELELLPNYPNPFRGRTTLEYALPERAEVRLAIYDVLGRRVRVLEHGQQRAGVHRLRWDGRNGAGQPVASGLYLVRLKAQGQQHVQKITLVR